MQYGNQYYFISSKLKESVLNYLTGLVLRTYNEEAKAQLFFNKAIEYINK